MQVYTARWLLPVAAPPVPEGAVAVDPRGRIAYAGPAAGAPPGLRVALGDAVLLPGLVAVAPTSARGDTIERAIGTGLTTVALAPAHPAALDALVASGLRAIAYQSVRGATPADRGSALTTLQRNVADLRARVAAAGAADRVRPGVAPGPVHAVHEDLLLDACAWAVAESLPLAVSAGADAAEVAYVRDASGPHADALRAVGVDVVRRAHSTVHLLAELGIAAVARPLLVGGAYFDESDVALAAYYNCPVAYEAVAYEEFSDGAPRPATPVGALLDAGARVALATADPLAAARALAPTAADALHLVTLGAARALDLAAEIGSLEPGKSADLCAFPLSPADLTLAASHGPTHALLARPARAAALTLVQGRPLRPSPA